MTKIRNNPSRELYGIIGSFTDKSKILKKWNKYFLDNNMDAFMDFYPATNALDIQKRFSEMFHFDRRAYIVSIRLKKAIIPFLDILDNSAKGEGSVNFVLNEKGVLVGYFLKKLSPENVLLSLKSNKKIN